MKIMSLSARSFVCTIHLFTTLYAIRSRAPCGHFMTNSLASELMERWSVQRLRRLHTDSTHSAVTCWLSTGKYRVSPISIFASTSIWTWTWTWISIETDSVYLSSFHFPPLRPSHVLSRLSPYPPQVSPSLSLFSPNSRLLSEYHHKRLFPAASHPTRPRCALRKDSLLS